jgi:hypothetical protein
MPLLTAKWQRVSLTATLLSSSGAQLVIGYVPFSVVYTSSTQVGQVQFLLWGASMAPGSTVVPYLATGASAVTTPTPGVVDDALKAEAIDLWKYRMEDQLDIAHRYRTMPPLIGR